MERVSLGAVFSIVPRARRSIERHARETTVGKGEKKNLGKSQGTPYPKFAGCSPLSKRGGKRFIPSARRAMLESVSRKSKEGTVSFASYDIVVQST